ncbi:MAG: hypothetical protein IT384_15885 [Deltaproteobacteria bacterium]|nr:hypothetical protein [Deltaproteobacteria bacterium]
MQLRVPTPLRLSALIVLAGLVACSSSERTIQGQVDRGSFRLSAAQVVAISTTGDTRRAALDAEGRFSIALPIGQTYELRFANSTRSAGVVDQFAYLSYPTSSGMKKLTFVLSEGPVIDVGLITPIHAIASSSAPLVGELQEAEPGVTIGPVQVCELSGGRDQVEAQAQNNLLAELDADGDDISDAADADSCQPDPVEACGCSGRGKGNNGHGNNLDGVDISNPGQGGGGPNGEVDQSAPVDDERHGATSSQNTSPECACICARVKNNNGHGNNLDGVDISNPGQGGGGPNGEVDPSAPIDDERNGPAGASLAEACGGAGSLPPTDVCTPPGETPPPDTCGNPPSDVPPEPGVPPPDGSGGSNDPNDPAGDADGDGVPNSEDPDDSDGDGTPDNQDPTPGGDPNDPNDPAGDADGDGVPNSSDPDDSDGDGIPDSNDPTPGGDPNDPNAPAGDADGDGVPNAFDPDDADGDGIPDNSDPTPGGFPTDPNAPAGDADGDGIPNANDPDPAGDGGGLPPTNGGGDGTVPEGGACTADAQCIVGSQCLGGVCTPSF